MASNSNFEPYAYLYDNGFFDPIEVIVDDNKHQEISYCHNNTSVYPRNTPSKKEKILGFLWDNKGNIFNFLMMMSLLTILLIIVLPACGEWFAAFLSIIILIILLVLGTTVQVANHITKVLYLKSKNLHLDQTIYTLDYNLDIIPIKLKDVWLDDEINYKCSVDEDENVKDFSEKEVFLTPEAASDTARIIREKRTEILSEILNGKTNNFLNSTKFFDYAQKYYQINFLDRFYRRISVYEFLMSRDSFVDFCEFIQETMATEKKDELKKTAQNEKCNKIANDILSERHSKRKRKRSVK